MNFTMKSGGLQYHGQVSDFVRNTIFDTWSFTARRPLTTKNAAGQTVPAPKPVEHQNELSASFGGKVPLYRGTSCSSSPPTTSSMTAKALVPPLFTIPTTLMQTGDFTELNGNVGGGGLTGTTNNPAILFDPTTTKCVGSTCTRQPFRE